MLELVDKARHELILENARGKRVEIKIRNSPMKEICGFNNDSKRKQKRNTL
jgi:hypothetical protein